MSFRTNATAKVRVSAPLLDTSLRLHYTIIWLGLPISFLWPTYVYFSTSPTSQSATTKFSISVRSNLDHFRNISIILMSLILSGNRTNRTVKHRWISEYIKIPVFMLIWREKILSIFLVEIIAGLWSLETILLE